MIESIAGAYEFVRPAEAGRESVYSAAAEYEVVYAPAMLLNE